MKYLKLYEAFDRDEYWDNYLNDLNSNLKKSKESAQKNWDDYYKSIDYDVASEHIVSMTEFPQEEFDDIKLIFSDVYKCRLNNWKIIDTENRTSDIFKYMIAEREGFKYKIWKLEDEWYLVEMSDPNTGLWFLCDQIDGLKALLNKTSIRK